ncbi:hypothetical protein ABEW00_05020 [Rossellomorea vietnamensis]|uniref:hypothetical protein n=1 Tax=Rossellomorea vietnamensis TaxID=218284 RepID=UPI003D280F06
MTIKDVTDRRPVIFCGKVELDGQQFYSMIVHNGNEIVDELFKKYIDTVEVLRTLSEVTETYGRYSSELLELHTDMLDVTKFALQMPGLHVRPLRRKELEPFINRTLQTWGDTIRELHEVEKPVELSKWRKWLINALIKLINKLDKKGDKLQ